MFAQIVASAIIIAFVAVCVCCSVANCAHRQDGQSTTVHVHRPARSAPSRAVVVREMRYQRTVRRRYY